MTAPAEFAPEYTRAQRLRLAGVVVLVAVVLALAAEVFLGPWLKDFLPRAHCLDFMGRDGLAWTLYAAFVGIPASMLLLCSIVLLPPALRGWRAGQFPAPGQRVLRRTRVRRGRQARWLWAAQLLPLLLFPGIAAWGLQQAERFSQVFAQPASDAGACQPATPLAGLQPM